MARLAPPAMAAPSVSSPSSSGASRLLSARMAALLSPLAALVITVAIGAALFAALGKPPARALAMFFVEPLRTLTAAASCSSSDAPSR